MNKGPARAVFYAGVEVGLEQARLLVAEVCDQRARELPAERASMAFTRDRILFALAEKVERAAGRRLEEASAEDPADTALRLAGEHRIPERRR